MAKNVKNAGNVTVGDIIYQVVTRPIFPGSDVHASEIVTDEVDSVERGPNKDQKSRTINKSHIVPLSGSLSKKVDDILFDEEDAIILWNKTVEENIKIAKNLIKERERELAKSKEDLDVILQIQKVAVNVAAKGSADYNTEGQIKEITKLSVKE